MSGVAIQSPGISRSCGVCGCRTLKSDELGRLVPAGSESILQKVPDDVCGRCGGKFVD